MTVKLKDILHSVLTTDKPPTLYDIVLPSPMICYHDAELGEEIEVPHTAFASGIFWGHDVIVDETITTPMLRLKSEYDYSNPLPFDEVSE